MNSKRMSAKAVRRGLYGMFAGGLLGGLTSATIAIPAANAQPDECSASAMAGTVSSVSAATSEYLAANPEVDEQLTDLSKQPAIEAQADYQTYFTDNPEVASDLMNIQQPVVDLSNQCGLEVTPTPVVEALGAL